MPKAEKGTPKDIAKQIKAKGLQKLKFYCQMCEKQCRDANGFKCHLTSEAHLRQMKIFSEHASGMMNSFSVEFEKTFMETLRMRHGTKEVLANNVYQQVIQDKHHIHMNSTIWATLSDFVKYLGKKGKVVAREDERGWYVTYIEQDANKIARQEALKKRQQAELQAEEALNERIKRQRIEAAKAFDSQGGEGSGGGTATAAVTNLDRSQGETVQVKLSSSAQKKKDRKDKPALVSSVFGEEDDESEEDDKNDNGPPQVPLPPKLESSSSSRKKKAKPSSWLFTDILVRIIDKKSRYFRRKAAVDRVVDGIAHVTVLDSGPDERDGGQVLQLEERHLETVAPKKTGKKVRILKGEHRGVCAVVREFHKDKYRAVLEMPDGTEKRFDYDDFSKVA